MRRFILYILWFCPLVGFSQISGIVFDKETEVPLSAVTIISNKGEKTISDSLGMFSLHTDSFPLTIYFSFLGYKPFSYKVTRMDNFIHTGLEGSSVNIQEIVISSTGIVQKLNSVAGNISVVTNEDISLSDNTRLQSSLNKLPGVFMQSGTLNTNRIIIRGIGSRSPYSTNRVKAYFENIPLTTGEGVTTIEDLDPESIGRIEVIKGPASGIYGAGLGGAISLYTKKPLINKYSANLSGSVGSFGLMKTSLFMGLNHGNSSVYAGANILRSQGYRENNALRRNSFHFYGNHDFHKSSLKFFIYTINLHAFIPSSLDKATFETNPRRAAQNWLNIKGYEDYSKVFTGLTVTARIKRHIYNSNTLFGSYYNEYESRPFNILQDRSSTAGLRSKLTFYTTYGTVVAGTELFNELYSWKLSETHNGVKGPQISDNSETRLYYNLFAHIKKELSNRLILTASLNYSTIEYITHIFATADSTETSAKHSFDPILSPRIGLTFKPSGLFSVYLLASHGFSSPSLEETLNPEGMVNPHIKPETGWNFETGIRSSMVQDRLTGELTFYSMHIKNLLVTKRLSEDIFTGINAGKTAHYGIEFSANYLLSNNSSTANGIYVVSCSSTVSKNLFVSFVDDNIDYSGKVLPGIPGYLVNVDIKREKKTGLSFLLNFQQTGPMYLNDTNSDNVRSYSLLNSKFIFTFAHTKNYRLDIYIEFNNILNTRYASMILVNALNSGNSGPRYYYPGLPFNLNGGIKIKFDN